AQRHLGNGVASAFDFVTPGVGILKSLPVAQVEPVRVASRLFDGERHGEVYAVGKIDGNPPAVFDAQRCLREGTIRASADFDLGSEQSVDVTDAGGKR